MPLPNPMKKRRPRALAPPRIHTPSVVLEGARLSPDVVVGAFSFVAASAVIGAGTRIQGHTSVWDGVALGADVFVGPGATFTNVRRPRAAFPRAPLWDRTIVEDGATIGAGAVLVAPVHVVGNPARIVGWACACGETVARGERAPEMPVCAECAEDGWPSP